MPVGMHLRKQVSVREWMAVLFFLLAFFLAQLMVQSEGREWSGVARGRGGRGTYKIVF